MVGLNNLRVFSSLSDSVTSGSGSTTSFNTETAKTQHKKKIKLREFHTNKFAQAKKALPVCSWFLAIILKKHCVKSFVYFPWEGKERKRPAQKCSQLPVWEIWSQVTSEHTGGWKLPQHKPQGTGGHLQQTPSSPEFVLPPAPFLTIDTRSFDLFCKYFLSKLLLSSSKIHSLPANPKERFFPLKLVVCREMQKCFKLFHRKGALEMLLKLQCERFSTKQKHCQQLIRGSSVELPGAIWPQGNDLQLPGNCSRSQGQGNVCQGQGHKNVFPILEVTKK